jgi:hypothetical protein
VDRRHRPDRRRGAGRRLPAPRRALGGAGAKDLDAVPLLLTTQDQVIRTIETAANYGGSLDVIIDDAPKEE